jgi:hypothetical protein
MEKSGFRHAGNPDFSMVDGHGSSTFVRHDGAVITAGRAAGRWIRERPDHVIDVFVYVVVLNLAIEYVPSVISEGFTLSLLTAVLLKVALEVVIAAKERIVARLRAATTRRAKIGIAVGLWVVAAGSKFVVLELVDVVFGDAVSLGGFVSVTLLILALLASRAAVRRILLAEGRAPAETAAEGSAGAPGRAL